MTIDKFLTISKAILCLSLAASFLFVMPYIVNSQLTSIRNDAKIELDSYRTDTVNLVNARFDGLQHLTFQLSDKLDDRINSLQTDTFKLAKDLRIDTFNSLQELQTNTFGLSADLRKDLFKRVDVVTNNLNNQTAVFNASISSLSSAYSQIPSTVGARFDRQTDCVHNGLCWQNLATDTLTNFRFTGKDISASANLFNQQFPVFISGVNTTVTNFGEITTNIKRITTPHWYDRILGYALNGAILYRNLNPVTNITLTGAQAVSSLK